MFRKERKVHYLDDEAPSNPILEAQEQRDAFNRGQDNRFRALGSNTTLNIVLTAVEAQKELTGLRTEAFARHLAIRTGKLVAEYQSKEASRKELSFELPKAFLINKGLRITVGKKRVVNLETAKA